MNTLAPGGRLPWWIALPTAALGGWMFDLANPGIAAWPLVFAAILFTLASWWKQRIGVAALAGLTAGAAFWLQHISWLTLYLGPIPWLALGTVMTAWFVVQAICTAVATTGIAALMRNLPAARRVVYTVLGQGLAVAGIWVLREGVQGAWPYGGFAWGRVAHVFAESPIGAAVSWVGFAGLTGLVVAAMGVVTAAILHTGETANCRRIVGSFVVAAALIGVLAMVPNATLEEAGTLRVAGIQGNSKSAIFDDRESGDVFADHIQATERLLDDLEDSGESVDMIVWPENAGEFGLNDNPLRGRQVALLSQRANAPIVVGTVLQNDDGSYWNSSLVWGPRGQQQPDASSRYDKRFPVPFAEYMPNRAFFHALVPDLVDLVQLEYSFGERPAVLPVDTSKGPIETAFAICFDIIFDNQAVEMVNGGAELILAQSNNADFGRTDESVQQLQIARLRAIETGRAVINISTVGTSVIVAPDGTNLASIEPFTSGAIVEEVPLVSGATPAITLGAWISAMWMLLGAAGIGAGLVGPMQRLRRPSK